MRVRVVMIGPAVGLLVLAGCASGAGPDSPTDRACKELAAAAAGQRAALAEVTEHGLDPSAGRLAGFSDQLRVVAADAGGGALAATLANLDDAADAWDLALSTGDVPGLVAAAGVVDDDLAACREADVSLPTS